jgi:hypothetical protein
MANLTSLINRLKKAKDDLVASTQDNEGWVRKGQFTPSNFWNTKAGEGLANAQRVTTNPQTAVKVGDWLRNNANAQADYLKANNAPKYMAPLISFAGDYGGNFAQAFTGGVIKGGTGLAKAIDPRLSQPQRLQGAIQTAYGIGGAASTATPLFNVSSLISSVPRNNPKDPDIIRRISAGITSGVSGQDLAKNVRDVKTNLGPLGEHDLLKGLGSMYGFTKNPTNKAIFGGTNPINQASWAQNPVTNYLLTRSFKGGVEGLLQGLGDMPDNLSDSQKAKFVMENILYGMGSEVVMDTLGEKIAKGARRVWDNPQTQKTMATAYDYIRDAKGRFAGAIDRLKYPKLTDKGIAWMKDFEAKYNVQDTPLRPRPQPTAEEIKIYRQLRDIVDKAKLEQQSGKMDLNAEVGLPNDTSLSSSKPSLEGNLQSEESLGKSVSNIEAQPSIPQSSKGVGGEGVKIPEIESKIEKYKQYLADAVKRRDDYLNANKEYLDRKASDFTPNVNGRKNTFLTNLEAKMEKSIQLDNAVESWKDKILTLEGKKQYLSEAGLREQIDNFSFNVGDGVRVANARGQGVIESVLNKSYKIRYSDGTSETVSKHLINSFNRENVINRLEVPKTSSVIPAVESDTNKSAYLIDGSQSAEPNVVKGVPLEIPKKTIHGNIITQKGTQTAPPKPTSSGLGSTPSSNNIISPKLSPSKGVGTNIKVPTNQTVQSEAQKVKIKQTTPEVQVKEAILADEKLKASQTAPLKTIAGGDQGDLRNPPSNGSIPEISDKDLVKKMAQAIKEANPLRGTQEELYTKARSRQLARIMKVRERVAGEKGFYQELGALKGDLPKVQYEAIRGQFTQGNVDRLFNMITTTKHLDEWEKINAQVGLSKILGEKGGGVPTKGELEKLYQVFGKEFTEALLSKRSIMEKLGELGMQLYNLPRSFMAGVGDLSGTLMQNALFAYRHPILTGKNFIQELKFFASDKAFRMSQEEIASRPTYELMKKARLSLTETGPLVNLREEAFMSNLAEKIPGIGKIIKASGRAYTGFLNRMRADVFDQMVQSYKNVGGDVNDSSFLSSLGEFVNTATGRGSLGKLERVAPVLGQGFFSARKLVATVQTLNPLFYVRQHPQVRKEALYTMLSYLGGATLLTQMSKLAGAEVGDDPTSTDFGKIKFGNTRFNLYGPYQQLAVLFARLWKGYATSSTTGKKLMLGDENNPYSPTRLDLLTRYFESKEHPTLSLIMSALRGTNSIGQPFNLPEETLNRFIPMVLSDGYDLYKEHGSVGLLGLIPAILGIPSQTYGSQIPYTNTTPTGKKTIKLKPTGGLAEDVIMKLKGESPSDIPQNQWEGILKTKTDESQKKSLKEEVKQDALKGKMERRGDFIPVTVDGEVKIIDLSFSPQPPKLTGNTLLDKKAISKYRGELTQKANNIYDLYEAGKISENEAEMELSKLKQKSDSLKSKKVSPGTTKKISFKVKPIKISMGTPKLKSLKVSIPKAKKISLRLASKKKKAIIIKKPTFKFRA